MPHQLRILDSADSVLVQTDVARSFLLKAGLDGKRVKILGLGIDPLDLDGGESERFKERFGAGSPIVTAIGPLTRDKGAQQLVMAANKVRAAGYPVTLVLAGPPMTDFEQFWAALTDVEKQHVLRLGPVVGDAKRDLLAATDILALPSRTDSFGIVLLEAWYYAKPVVGANAGGIPGLIDDGENGRLVTYDDVDALAGAMLELIRDPQKAALWGANGRQKVLKDYTWDAAYERFRIAIGIG
jgi:glycogen synthase